MVTKPLRFSDKELKINYATSAAGGLQVEIQDSDGSAIPCFVASDCDEIVGDEIERVVFWKQISDFAQIAEKPVRLRFVMKDVDLYSLRLQ